MSLEKGKTMAASKRLYVAIAKVFRLERKMTYRTRMESIASLENTLGEIFKIDNPAFDTDRFLNACRED